MSAEEQAREISSEGIDDIRTFVTGFAKFIEEKEIENKKFVIEAYAKMNIATLIYNAIILREELQKRTSKKKNGELV